MSQRHLVGALLAAMAFVLILLGDHTVVSTADQTQGGFRGSGNQKWVGTWATSPQATSDNSFEAVTTRVRATPDVYNLLSANTVLASNGRYGGTTSPLPLPNRDPRGANVQLRRR